MTNSIKQFYKNIDSINIIDGIYLYFENQVKAIDISEILRAQYVLLISAFDYYIHDVVREGMVKIFSGVNPENDNYNNFTISLNVVRLILATDDTNVRRQLLDNEIRKINSKQSYQAPTSVEKALRLIAIKSIWSKVGAELSLSAEDVTKKLGLIVNRRNKIAHEADIDTITNNKTTIDRQTLIEVKDFITKVVAAIDNHIV